MTSISRKRIVFIDFQDADSNKTPLTEGLSQGGKGLRSWFVSKKRLKEITKDEDYWKDNDWRLEFEYILKFLDPTERIIMKFLVNGMTQQEIAEQLDITQPAVCKKIKNLAEKVKTLNASKAHIKRPRANY